MGSLNYLGEECLIPYTNSLKCETDSLINSEAVLQNVHNCRALMKFLPESLAAQYVSDIAIRVS